MRSQHVKVGGALGEQLHCTNCQSEDRNGEVATKWSCIGEHCRLLLVILEQSHEFANSHKVKLAAR